MQLPTIKMGQEQARGHLGALHTSCPLGLTDMGWQIYDNQADSRAGSRMTTCLEIPALKNWRLLALPTSGYLHPLSLCSL